MFPTLSSPPYLNLPIFDASMFKILKEAKRGARGKKGLNFFLLQYSNNSLCLSYKSFFKKQGTTKRGYNLMHTLCPLISTVSLILAGQVLRTLTLFACGCKNDENPSVNTKPS